MIATENPEPDQTVQVRGFPYPTTNTTRTERGDRRDSNPRPPGPQPGVPPTELQSPSRKLTLSAAKSRPVAPTRTNIPRSPSTRQYDTRTPSHMRRRIRFAIASRRTTLSSSNTSGTNVSIVALGLAAHVRRATTSSEKDAMRRNPEFDTPIAFTTRFLRTRLT